MAEKGLKQWVKDNSVYISLADEETYEGIYHDYRIIPSPLDPSKETVQYMIDDKFLQTSSKSLANAIDDVPKGSRVKITRHGLKQNTKYEVEVL